jgi:SAM-dependent methyltransferase
MMDYFSVYTELYAKGYRGGKKFTGIKWARTVTDMVPFTTVLDVGCARGEGCRYFKSERKLVKGCDVAAMAVAQAKKFGFEVELASATQLPYKDGEFDMVFSSDVVEHIAEEDISIAIGEMVRVSNTWVALQIAKGKSKHVEMANSVGLPNFHITTWDQDRWLEFFTARQDVNISFYGWSGKYVMCLLRKVTDK